MKVHHTKLIYLIQVSGSENGLLGWLVTKMVGLRPPRGLTVDGPKADPFQEASFCDFPRLALFFS